mmetsp:Transcript_34018/g.57748  ORF Transcript_34018/g.57748 Transcript_34018/m.57748 type:complete len:355 (+) Transcript_34018:369-1433(+)
MHLIQLEQILGTSQIRRHPHVHAARRIGQNIQNPSIARAPGPSGLFHDHGHGGRFVEETELAVGILGRAGVAVDAAVEEDVVDVGDHGADVAGGDGLSVHRFGRLHVIQELLRRLIVIIEVRLIETVNVSNVRNANVGMGLQEGILIGIQRESVDSVAHGQDQHARGRVQAVPRADHLRPALQEPVHGVPVRTRLHPLGDLIDSEDGPHGQAGIDVLRSVDGIEDGDVIALLVPADLVPHDGLRAARHVLLLGRHGGDGPVAPPAQRPQHVRVAQNIELLLHLPLDVLLEGLPRDGIDGRAVEVVGLGALDDAVDLLAGVGDGVEGAVHGFEVGELPRLDFEEALEGAQIFLLF